MTISVSHKKEIAKSKTLIYRRVPKDIYSFYECVGLRLEGKVIKQAMLVMC